MNWKRSERFDEWPGCRFCAHWRAGKCAAYPDRIPLIIISGEVDHMVKRPEQVGDTVFEPMDIDHWYRTGERIPISSSTQAVS
jgi:hypothetical protein